MKLFGRKTPETLSSVYATPSVLRVVDLRLVDGRPIIVRVDSRTLPDPIYSTDGMYHGRFSDAVSRAVRSTGFLAVHAIDETCIGGVCEVPTNHLKSTDTYQGVFASHISGRGYDPRGFICDVSVIEPHPVGVHVAWMAYPTEHQSAVMTTRPGYEGFAMDRSQRHLYRLYDIPADTPFVWVSLEGTRFHAMIIRGDAILDEVLIQTGSRELINTIQSHLDSDRQFANEVLRRHGVLRTHHDSDLQTKLTTIAQQWVAALCDMVNAWRTSTYRPNYARAPIAIMVSAGVLADIPGLESLFAGSVQLSVWRRVHPSVVQLIQRSPQTISRSTIGRYAAPLAHALRVLGV